MRLISCVALLMVIPAIGLLTNENKFKDKKIPATPVRQEPANDSATSAWFNQSGMAANFNLIPFIATTDYHLSFAKPLHSNSNQCFNINK
ncbi:hypothetical protein [Pedobacter sp. KLB.chiD]|uniref:hypothetical protein n=1 Tax=Pedobacter sp. KLB.chiD TaxID=3387402 RepID=UPI00399BDE3D